MKNSITIIALSIFLIIFCSNFSLPPSASVGSEIAIIINKDNPVSSLTSSEAKLYFLRKIKKRWPEINKNIRPVDRKAKCTEQETFYSKILGMTSDDVEKYFTERQYQNAEKPPDEFSSDKEIIDFVGTEIGAIGYVNINSLTTDTKAKLKVVLNISN